MDRTVLLRRLGEAERQLAAYEQVVARQRHVIDTIARGGHDRPRPPPCSASSRESRRRPGPAGIGFVWSDDLESRYECTTSTVRVLFCTDRNNRRLCLTDTGGSG